MTDQLREFIKDNIHFVDEYKFEEFYSHCPVEERKDLTEFLLDIGINPDCYMNIIPDFYLQQSDLTKYSVPDGIDLIGKSAFSHSKIENIKLPDTVRSIEEYAFSTCEQLVDVVIPDSVVYIGLDAFALCEKLTNVTIGKGVIKIESGVFDCCLALESMIYTGTKEMWKKIDKGSNAFRRVLCPVVQCTDGTVRLRRT